MYDITLRYLASVFVDAGSISVSAKHVADLLDRLGDDTLLPTTVLEQTPAGVSNRIGFRSGDGQWHLIVASSRIDFARTPGAAGVQDPGGFDEFCQAAASKLVVPLEYFGRRGHRLAAVQEGLLPELPSEKIDAVRERLLNVPEALSGESAFEWDWRCAFHLPRSFGGHEEKTNTIVTAKRLSGNIDRVIAGVPSRVPFDRIRLDLDINTWPQETTARFGQEDVFTFFKEVGPWHAELSTMVGDLMGTSNGS